MLSSDAAEVVLFRCINRIKNEREEVTAIEMSFAFLDDFEDPVQDGICGLVKRMFADPRHRDQDEIGVELQSMTNTRCKKYPKSPKIYSKQNHVLQWMVMEFVYIAYYCNNYSVNFR